MSCCIGELRDKDVINICDGKCLGYVCDVEIDICTGRLVSIIVPGNNKFFSLSRANEITIPWEKIEKIGDDTILVSVHLSTRCEKERCCKNK